MKVVSELASVLASVVVSEGCDCGKTVFDVTEVSVNSALGFEDANVGVDEIERL